MNILSFGDKLIHLVARQKYESLANNESVLDYPFHHKY